MTPEDNLRKMNKTSLGAISEAESFMEGSKAAITSKSQMWLEKKFLCCCQKDNLLVFIFYPY